MCLVSQALVRACCGEVQRTVSDQPVLDFLLYRSQNHTVLSLPPTASRSDVRCSLLSKCATLPKPSHEHSAAKLYICFPLSLYQQIWSLSTLQYNPSLTVTIPPKQPLLIHFALKLLQISQSFSGLTQQSSHLPMHKPSLQKHAASEMLSVIKLQTIDLTAVNDNSSVLSLTSKVKENQMLASLLNVSSFGVYPHMRYFFCTVRMISEKKNMTTQ